MNHIQAMHTFLEQRKKTHKVRVVVEYEVSADSDGHAKVIVEERLRGQGYEVISSEVEKI